MIHDHLTDYQIAEAFGDTLSSIYKKKMEELNEKLIPVHVHLDSLLLPKFTDLDRQIGNFSCQIFYKQEMDAVDHIVKIRKIWHKIKNAPEREPLNIQRAKAVPITSLYDFRAKGKNVSCPFHGDDKNPSMSLRNNKFHCFTCGAKGDSIEFYQRIHGVKFRAAVEALNKL